MPKKKKPFIDKKNSVTYKVVHRSQRDPLQADEEAPKRVLVPITEEENQSTCDSSLGRDVVRRKEEQKEFGIYFDDDYNYLQHLKRTDEVMSDDVEIIKIEPIKKPKTRQGVVLPTDVLPSLYEDDIGLLNRAAPIHGPRLDMDPDIVAGLDDDFDFDNPDNILDDDFIIKANDEKFTLRDDKLYSDDNSEDYETASDSENDDLWNEKSDSDGNCTSHRPQVKYAHHDFDSGSDDGGKDFDAKSRFSGMSLSSSVIRRNKGLTLLDEKFDKIYEEYDDIEMGGLECDDDVDGFLDPESEQVKYLLKEFEKEKEENMKVLKDLGPSEPAPYCSDSEGSGEEDITVFKQKLKPEFDCESIISTYSNLYNHPRLIEEPRKKSSKIAINKKTGIPKDILGKEGLTARNLKFLNEMNANETHSDRTEGNSVYSMLSSRCKNETKEEKLARKEALRFHRKERRQEKKANTLAFRDERERQLKEVNNLKNNLHGVRLF